MEPPASGWADAPKPIAPGKNSNASDDDIFEAPTIMELAALIERRLIQEIGQLPETDAAALATNVD